MGRAAVPEPAAEATQATAWKGTLRYEVVRRVGEGGMGAVYEVRDREDGQHLAVKTLLRFSPDELYRFKREFRILADVRHHNLVRLLELVVTEAEQPFFVMELVAGKNFVAHVQRDGSLAVSDRPTRVEPRPAEMPGGAAGLAPQSGAMRAASMSRGTTADLDKLRPALRQLVDGLHVLHVAGKLHRDVKPSNVLVTPEGRVVILDFGVAAELSHVGNPADDEHEVVGTAKYMAPEQALGDPLTPAADWYGVGVMLYEALVGRPPFMGSAMEVLSLKSTTLPMPPRERVQDVPADLDALCTALLDPDPARRPGRAEILGRLGSTRSLWPGRSPVPARKPEDAALVGREAHLAALRDAFQATQLGRSLTVRVGGRSGMGKSAVVTHFLDRLVEERQALVLRGRAYERESVPYKAVDSIVDALSRHLMKLEEDGHPVALPDDMAALARIFPVLRRVPSIGAIAEEEATDPRRVRQRAFRALRDLLRRVAGQQPLVLYMDDVQWGDADSAALLLDVVRPPDPPPLLVVMTYRDNEVATSPFLAETAARWPEKADAREISVGPLSAEEARRLAVTLLGRDEDPLIKRTALAVARESGGSPFLVEELARSAGAHLSDSSGSERTLVSITLGEMVSERLARLPEGPRRLLEMLAVGGRPLSLAMVRDAAGGYEAAQEAVSLLDARRFVHAGLRDGREVVETIHDRIRETIAGMLPAETVRSHHARLARALEATPDADPEALATHLLGAGEKERAAPYAERAAERAASKLAFDQAASLLRLTLETKPAGSPDARRLRLRLAEVLEWAGNGAEAASVYLQAAEGAPAMQRAELERAAAEQLLTCGRIDEGAAVLGRVLATAGLRAPSSPLSAVFWLIVYRVWARVIGLRFVERDPDDVTRVDRLRLDALYAAALGFAIVNVVLGACIQTRYLVAALRAGDRTHMLRAALMLVTQHANLGGPETRRESALKALIVGLVEKSGSIEDLAFFHGTQGVGLFLRGRWTEALRVLDAAYAKYPNQRAGWQSNSNLFGVYALLYLGDVAELAQRRARLLQEADQRGDRYTSVNLRISPPKILALAADDPEGARRDVRKAMAEWSQRGYLVQHWQAMRVEADVELYVGAAARAYERVARDAAALKRSFLLQGQFTRSFTADVRGRCAVALAEAAPAQRAARLAEARRLARQLERERMPYAALLAAILRAGVASLAGERERAAKSLQLAVDLAGQTDMALHAMAARYQLGALIAGDKGGELLHAADEEMKANGVVAPKRFADVLVPGRWQMP
ncbi:MAG: serine/threonine-protein kinase PknK [Polyangiaceae bacterium]